MTSAEALERVCPQCGLVFVPEMMEIGFSGYHSRVPRFGRLCSDRCVQAEEESRQEDAAEADRRLAEKYRREMAGRDPEDALLRAGFSDKELFGKHLGNFERLTSRHEERWRQVYEFARGGADRQSLVMLGEPGRGKTHLARGIARSWVQLGREVRYYKLGDLIARCKELMGGGGESPEQYVAWICRFPGLVIIDELGRSAGNNWDTNQVVYQLADKRQGRPTVWISNFSLEYLADHYDEAVSSRLQRGLVIHFPSQMEDFRGR